MYIKVAESSPLGQRISEMWEKGIEYGNQAFDWAASQGADYHRGAYFAIFGGISSAHFNGKSPKGWIKAGAKYEDGEYLIGKSPAGKELQRGADLLPVVSNKEFNELLCFNPNKRTTNRRCFHPGIRMGKDNFILLSIPDHTIYTPIDDMVEITVTKYSSLLQKSEE